MDLSWISLLTNAQVQMTISLGDIIIILLFIVLIRKLRIPADTFIYDMIRQAPWLLSLIKYWNDRDAGLRMAVEAIKMMIRDGIITREQAVEILAREIAKRRKRAVYSIP